MTAGMKRAEHFHVQPLPSVILVCSKIHRDNASRRSASCSGKLSLQCRNFVFERLNLLLNISEISFKSFQSPRTDSVTLNAVS